MLLLFGKGIGVINRAEGNNPPLGNKCGNPKDSVRDIHQKEPIKGLGFSVHHGLLSLGEE